MLRLGNEISGDDFGICRFICPDHKFRGTRQHINAAIPGDISFGGSHPAVAGPDNHVTWRYAFDTKGHGANGLGSAESKQ